MRSFKLYCLILAAALAGTAAWADNMYPGMTSQTSNDVAGRLSDLKLQKVGYDAARADLASQKKALAEARQRKPFSVETERIRSLIGKDRTIFENYYSRMLGDIQYLQARWSEVPPADRKYVSSVEKSLN